MINLLTAVFAIVLTWTVIAAAMTGLGVLVYRLVQRGTPETQLTNDSTAAEIPVLFWVGYAASAGFLQIWHLLLPVNAVASLLLLVTGFVALFCFGLPHLTGLLGAIRTHPVVTLAFVVFAGWAAMHAAGPGVAHDTGMYHYGILQWFQIQPSVPGLGNLSLLFAHNPAHLLIGAAIDQGPWDGRSQHILNGLMVFVMGGLAIRGMALAVREPKGWLNWYDAMLFVPVVMFVLTKELPNPKTDSAPAFLMFMLVRQTAKLLTSGQETSAQDRSWLLITMGIFGAAGVIAKLSTGPLVAAIIPIAAVFWWRGLPMAARVRTALITAAIGILLIVPWMTRNVITSGYPLFPSPIIAVSTDWTMPVEPIRQEMIDISQHGKLRLPDASYWAIEHVVTIPSWLRLDIPDESNITRWNWMPAWLITMPAHSPVICFVPLVLLVCCLALAAIRRPVLSPPRGLSVLTIPLVFALAIWFFNTPTHRFATGITWPLIAVCVAAIVPSRFNANTNARRIAIALLIAPGIASAVFWGVVEQKVRGEPGNPLIRVLVQKPGPDRGLHPRPVQEHLVIWESRHGVKVTQPESGRLIWNAPQPAVGWPEELDPDLAYREPGNLRAGFRLQRD